MTTLSLRRAIALPRPRKLTPLERREARWGLLFISPWLVGFVLFTLLPTLATLDLLVHQHQPGVGGAVRVRRPEELPGHAGRRRRCGRR